MQAIILAAGRGRRMEPLSSTCHKALLEIGGMTILGRAVDGLLAADVQLITIVTGYLSDDVMDFMSAKYPRLKVNYIYNADYATTNNIVSLALALESLPCADDVLLVECDLLFDPSLIRRLIDHPDENVALVDRYRTGMDGTVVACADGYVAQVFPTESQGPDFNYADKFKTINIYRFGGEFCRNTLQPVLSAYARHVNPNSYYELVLGMLANIPAHRIAAEVVLESDWVEVDDPNDLSVARFAFDPTQRSAILDRTYGGHWALNILDFSLPRNAYFPTGAMLAALRHALPEVITGYGSAQDVLDEKAALYVGCSPQNIRLLAGASQAFPILARHFAGRRVAIPSPTFGEYPRWFPEAAPYPDALGTDRKQFADYAVDADVLVIVNPNNPSGATLPTAWLYELAMDAPTTTFVIDESFLPFSGEASMVARLEREPLKNVVILASLGKALGVPGLRLGYVYTSCTEVQESFSELMPIWGVNALAEYFLELCIKFRADLDRSIAETVVERSRLKAELEAIPLVRSVPDSGANFLAVELCSAHSDSARKLREALLERSRIEVKDVTSKFQDGHPRLRIAVRTRSDNDRLLMALKAAAKDFAA